MARNRRGPFHIGDMVKVIRAEGELSHLLGQECTITSELQTTRGHIKPFHTTDLTPTKTMWDSVSGDAECFLLIDEGERPALEKKRYRSIVEFFEDGRVKVGPVKEIMI